MAGQHPVWGGHPKIVAFLHRPEAAAARLELETCEKLGLSPSQFRGRPTVATHVYDDAGRVVRVVTAGVWTAEDRALMLAWATYQAELCPGCGHPKATAWHHQSIDSFDLVGDFVCWACTARQPVGEDGSREPVKFPVVEDSRDYETFPLVGPPQPEIPD